MHSVAKGLIRLAGDLDAAILEIGHSEVVQTADRYGREFGGLVSAAGCNEQRNYGKVLDSHHALAAVSFIVSMST